VHRIVLFPPSALPLSSHPGGGGGKGFGIRNWRTFECKGLISDHLLSILTTRHKRLLKSKQMIIGVIGLTMTNHFSRAVAFLCHFKMTISF
jgi:hypothetical protein